MADWRSGSNGDQLVGWKAIGAFLSVDARTAKRWERERGLPVRRLPGGNRATVWADPAELRLWMYEPRAAAQPPLPAKPVAAARRTPLLAGFAAAGLLLAAGLAAVTVRQAGEETRPVPPFAGDAAANLLWREASFAMSSRSAAGLEEAALKFSRLADSHPRNPAPHVGLAETYLLMREFAALPDEAAYRRGRDAAEAALRLDPADPAANRALGFVLFWSESDRARGLALLQEAVRLQPQDSRSRHWLGTALSSAGRHEEALAELARARALAPDAPAIAADEGLVRWLAGDRATGLDMLERIAKVRPDFVGGHRYLEWIHLAEGNDPAYLAAATAHARLRGDAGRLAVLARAAEAHAAGGRPAMLAVLLAAAEADHAAGSDSAINVARLAAAAGDREATRRWLDRARAAREPYVQALAVVPELRGLAGDPEFRAYFDPGRG